MRSPLKGLEIGDWGLGNGTIYLTINAKCCIEGNWHTENYRKI